MFKNIAKNFLSLIIAQVIYKIFSFVSIVYIARKIGDAGFGQLSFALYLGSLFLAFADMGLSEFFIYDAAGDKNIESSKIGINMGTRIFLSATTFLLIIGCSFMLAAESKLIVTIMLIGIAMILDSFTLFLRSIFRSREKMQYEAISFILEGIIKFALVIISLKFFGNNLITLGMAFLMTSFLALIGTIIICSKRFIIAKPIIKLKECAILVKKGVPFAIVGFLCIVNLKIDVVMLSKLSNDYITGWYSAAARLIESLLIIPAVASIALFPVLSRLRKGSSKSFADVCRVSFIACIIVGAAIGIFLYTRADFLISFIFGDVFVKSVEVLKILSWVFIPFFLKFLLERVALVMERAGILFIAYGGGVILKIALNFIIIPIWNYKGVGFATLITESLIVAYILFCTKKDRKLLYAKQVKKDSMGKSLFFYEER